MIGVTVGTATCSWYVKYSAKKPSDKDKALQSLANVLKHDFAQLLPECEVRFNYNGPPDDLVQMRKQMLEHLYKYGPLKGFQGYPEIWGYH